MRPSIRTLETLQFAAETPRDSARSMADSPQPVLLRGKSSAPGPEAARRDDRGPSRRETRASVDNGLGSRRGQGDRDEGPDERLRDEGSRARVRINGHGSVEMRVLARSLVSAGPTYFFSACPKGMTRDHPSASDPCGCERCRRASNASKIRQAVGGLI